MNSQTQDRDETLEQTVGNIVENTARIGRLWAVYGLEIGRAALRTSSETLKATSEILGSLAKTLGEDAPDASPTDEEPASEQPA